MAATKPYGPYPNEAQRLTQGEFLLLVDIWIAGALGYRCIDVNQAVLAYGLRKAGYVSVSGSSRFHATITKLGELRLLDPMRIGKEN